MAQTNIFVDPSLNSDTGAGSVGNPYGDLEWAIEQATFDLTNGTQINVKTGSVENLVAAMEAAFANTGTSIAWVPIETAVCSVRGYTTSANDGGIGVLDGGGSVSIMGGNTLNYISFIDMELRNTGSNDIISLNDYISFIRCNIHNTNDFGIDADQYLYVEECYIHNVGDVGIEMLSFGTVVSSTFENETNDFTDVILMGPHCRVDDCILIVDGTTNGIEGGKGCMITNTAVWSNAGSGTGIRGVNNDQGSVVQNNMVEGFSASGGKSYDFNFTDFGLRSYKGNTSFASETHYVAVENFVNDGPTDNETLSVSGFVDASGGDFNPVDTGNVKEGSHPFGFGKV